MAAVILSQAIPGSAASGPAHLGIYGNANAVSTLLFVCISFCILNKIINYCAQMVSENADPASRRADPCGNAPGDIVPVHAERNDGDDRSNKGYPPPTLN